MDTMEVVDSVRMRRSSRGGGKMADKVNLDSELVRLQQAIGCDGHPLGMEHGHIPDSALAASSTFDMHSVGPHIARARKDFKGGAWCPARPIQEGVEEWLEVDLGSQHIVTATETMGRFGGGR